MSINAPQNILIIKDCKLRSDRPEGYRFAALVDGST